MKKKAALEAGIDTSTTLDDEGETNDLVIEFLELISHKDTKFMLPIDMFLYSLNEDIRAMEKKAEEKERKEKEREKGTKSIRQRIKDTFKKIGKAIGKVGTLAKNKAKQLYAKAKIKLGTGMGVYDRYAILVQKNTRSDSQKFDTQLKFTEVDKMKNLREKIREWSDSLKDELSTKSLTQIVNLIKKTNDR